MKSSIIILFLSFCCVINAQKTAPISVLVLNTKNKPYQGDKVYFVGQKTKKSYSGITNVAGKFLINLPEGEIYDIKIKSIGDEVEYNTLEIPSLAEDQFYEETQLTITYEASKNYTLNSLQFESGKAELKSNSYALLADLLEIMQLKPDMKIKISGHTDSDGNDASNLVLSQQRAEAVKNYLISKGIASSRMIAIGFGETKPIDTNTTEAGKKVNRRTEILVL